MHRNVYKREFRKADKKLDAGTIIKKKSGIEYVILGFEEKRPMYVLCYFIEKEKYLKQPEEEDINFMPLDLMKEKVIGTVDKKEFDVWLLKVQLFGYCKNLETREQIKERNKNKIVFYRYGFDISVEQFSLIITSHIVMATVCFLFSVLYRPCIYLLFVVLVSFVLMLFFTCLDISNYEIRELDKK